MRLTAVMFLLMSSQNTPFSALVCGVQGARLSRRMNRTGLTLFVEGSGKSHTVSVMLENMFISGSNLLGHLEKPLAGLVLHFGEGGIGSSPCEAAWVGVTDILTIKAPKVKVFVSKSSLNTMKTVYAPLLERGNVTVEPLLFDEAELDAQAFLSMMAVGSSDNAPLYVQIILVTRSIVDVLHAYKLICLFSRYCETLAKLSRTKRS